MVCYTEIDHNMCVYGCVYVHALMHVRVHACVCMCVCDCVCMCVCDNSVMGGFNKKDIIIYYIGEEIREMSLYLFNIHAPSEVYILLLSPSTGK